MLKGNAKMHERKNSITKCFKNSISATQLPSGLRVKATSTPTLKSNIPAKKTLVDEHHFLWRSLS